MEGAHLSVLVTALVLLCATLATYRLTTFVTRDTLTEAARLRLAHRYRPRVRPLLDANGDPAMIHNEAADTIEPAVTMKPHPVVVFANCDRCLSVWFAAAVIASCHGVGLLDRWPLVALGWLAVAGAVALLVDVVG